MKKLCAGSLLLSAALALTPGCKKDEGGDAAEASTASEGEAAAKAEAKAGAEAKSDEVAGAELLARVDECQGFYESWDKEAYRGCFAESPTVTYVDNVPPDEVSTLSEVLVRTGAFRNAFADFEAERSLILVDGTKSVLISRISGTHRNGSLGMPPTGKSIQFLYGEVAEHDDRGRTTRARYYLDTSTLLHQLGILESASATSAEASWDEPVRQVAEGSESEASHLEAVKASLLAVAEGDVDGAVAMYGDEATFRYLPEGQPYVGLEEIRGRVTSYAELGLEVSIRDAWAAGDWVVVELTTRSKLEEDFSGAEGTKGKSWEINSLELARFEDGKVAEHWSLANGLKFAADVGLFDPSMLMVEEGR